MDFDYVVVPALILLIAALTVWLSIRRIRLLANLVHRRWKRVAERIVLSGLVLFAALVAVNSCTNAIVLG